MNDSRTPNQEEENKEQTPQPSTAGLISGLVALIAVGYAIYVLLTI